jgi:hypothetical protein
MLVLMSTMTKQALSAALHACELSSLQHCLSSHSILQLAATNYNFNAAHMPPVAALLVLLPPADYQA